MTPLPPPAILKLYGALGFEELMSVLGWEWRPAMAGSSLYSYAVHIPAETSSEAQEAAKAVGLTLALWFNHNQSDHPGTFRVYVNTNPSTKYT